jgi:phosphoribosylanthranilate isomerase
MFVKVCGVKEFKHIDWAVELGFHFVGIVLYAKSKRFVTYEKAKEMARYAKGRIKTVAVGVSYADVKNVADCFDYIQVYENVDVDNLIFASCNKPENINFRYFLYDRSKGSGKFEDFPEWLKEYKDKLIVAGGLNFENVKGVIERFKPFGVDVSSGVENQYGEKDYMLMEKFIKNAKGGGI